MIAFLCGVAATLIFETMVIVVGSWVLRRIKDDIKDR